MQDEIVIVHTANLAKSKGFDFKTVGYYTFDSEDKTYGPYCQFNDYEFTAHVEELWYNFNSIPNSYGIDYISAPTQSLLQRWLREKHNLHIEVKVQDQVDSPSYYWSIFGKHSNLSLIVCLENSGDKFRQEFFSTYELALESALQASLERIK